ncbi:DUF2141 domain-containing protein [Pseudoteredinibacter isoporae]|uniref:Uncharacterized protein (DUF2141 family) n=2 Tax=Pseudoteredinibacter isoporae TaxID=570281 RepID=A0A7X0MXP3_9GAMM|nr:DUF2141 domain-containing protein [Pseudoteredinibacter isoporae]MBB6523683.1 uncharacterized protein (DUF2141 family) [Pseudoteredinibacter isoporae]NHO89186.1 DUF2141 domain-containing protein [Pseudoteredinibacter isoporae]NIB22203.1 DUF2141 domain-containing protein [Pseudoteredinibacter isoporae]
MKRLSHTSKTITSMLALLGLACSPLTLAEQSQHQLTLLIKGYEESKGTTYLSLYDDAEHFNKMDGKSVANVQQRINGDTLRITFHDLNAGEYAVSLYHDANNNRELDRNMLGIPSEPYGFSNDAGAFGPAKFNKASFKLEEDKTIVINLR